MTYAIAKSSARPQGGFFEFSKNEWDKDALARGYGADYERIFHGVLDRAIEFEKAPKYVIIEKPKPNLPNMFWGSSSLLIVSGVYHDIIERLDPGLHQLWPIELRRKRKEPYSGRWYGLNIRPRAASIQVEGSDTYIAKGSEILGIPDQVKLNISFKVSVRSDLLPGANLWWDDGIDQPVILCSDELRNAVVDAGLQSIPLIKAQEI